MQDRPYFQRFLYIHATSAHELVTHGKDHTIGGLFVSGLWTSLNVGFMYQPITEAARLRQCM